MFLPKNKNIETLKNKFDVLFDNTTKTLNHYAKRGYWISKKTNNNSIMYIGLNLLYPHLDYEMTERVFYDEYEQTHHAYF